MTDAYLNDPDVIDAMANAYSPTDKPPPPSFFGWTAELSALKDIQDQMIASRGGTRFVPRPVIPGLKEMWRRRDNKLMSKVSKITGSD